MGNYWKILGKETITNKATLKSLENSSPMLNSYCKLSTE